MTTHQGGVKGPASQQKQHTGQPGMGGRFLIGEELGRGAYGQVFKGMDSTTGDVVAIKQIGLAGVSQENLAGVMGEIDLLKTLNHKNIVKYVGSFKSRSHLYIILEYMENGALSSVIKPNRFGVFPESLVAIYIAQVLQGLAYLHEQGVVHRDIKGANILTTKDGLVKLADFGVAAKLGELEEQHCDELHQNVAGSPYWMAPEVIEMTQVTPASDIWSVGCLIIELLTGYPPYYDLQPMSALFRIVQDGHPPLPENVSPLLEDFLLKCFQKDPSARPDARSLLQHEWVQFNRRTLRGTWNRSQGFKSRTAAGAKATDAHETVNSVVSRILQAEGSEDELSLRGSTEITAGPGGGGGSDTAVRTIDAAAGPLASNTPARLALQQDALQSAGVAGAAAVPINLLNAPTLPSPVPVAGSPGEAYTIQQHQQQQRQQRHGSIELAAAPQQANGPSGASISSPRSRLSQPSAFSSAAQQQQQYAMDQQQLYVQQQQQQQQDQDQGSPGAGSGLSYVGQQLHYGPGPGGSRHSPVRTPFQADAISPLSSLLARIQGDAGAAGTPSAASVAAAHGGGGSQSLLHWLDDGPAAAAGRSPGSFSSLAAGPSRGQLLEGGLFGGGSSYLVAGASTNSLDSMSAASSQVGLENGGGETNFQLESKRKVRDLVRSLRPGARDANMTPQQAALGLAAMFARLPDARQHFLSEGGVLAAIELLESDSARLAESAVDLLSAFTAADTRLLESLCLVGLVPIVVRMAAGSAAWPAAGGGGAAAAAAAPGAGAGGAAGGGLGGGVAPGQAGLGGRPGDTSTGGAGGGAAGLPWGGGLPSGSAADLTRLRSKAAGFVAQLCFAKETTLQMFIACGGLRGLVVMVQDNLADPSTLTLTAVACIWQVLETYGALPLNYICRIFAHAGLVQRLHAVIKQLISLGRQQQTLQQQQQQQRGGGPAAAAAAALKLHHLHSPSSPSVFGQALLPLGLEGGEGPEMGGGGSSSSSSAAAAAAAGRGRGREAGLAGMDELQQQRMDASSGSSSSRLPQLPQQQQQQHRRAHSVDDQAAAAAAAAAAAGGPQQTRAEWLLEKCLDLLLVMAHMDGVVKGVMCSRDNLQQLLDLTQRLGPPSLLKVMKTIRWLTSEPSVLPAVKDSGAIGQLVPFLSREREALVGQAVVLEALQALYNICKFNKRVHLEVAATGGIVPHLCRFASEAVAAAAAAPPNAAAGGGGSLAPAAGDPLSEPAALSAAAARDARRAAVRTFVVPLLIGMASTSSSTRAKLWASNGLDLFLQLLGTEDSAMQVGLMRTLDIWLAEDAARVENRLCQREAVGQLSEVYSRLCRSASARSPVMPQMLDSLKVILNRSPKVAVALAAGGLVPPLLEPLTASLSGPGAGGSAPILRAKLLEIIRLMYQHSPRPKEFVLKYRIQDVLLRLLEAEGRGEDAVKVEAQKLLNAFHINVLL